ncbi:MAG: hypothetical protein HZB29_03570 [Nitrospinae bacterium]|nr:hypothetical protein [Nitrospinota bacterium]
MKELSAESFDIKGDTYILTCKAAVDEGVVQGIVSSKAGKEISRIKYTVTEGLMKKWEISRDEAVRFILRFAKFHTQTRLARCDLAKLDEYVFDVDFAATKPEAVAEKVESEWRALFNKA